MNLFKVSCFILITSLISLNAKSNNTASLKVPTTYSKLGLELRTLQTYCIKYQKDMAISEEIKEQCAIYNTKVTATFKIGNILDKKIANGNKDKKEIKEYLFSLRNTDKSKQTILRTMHKEVREARKKKNFSCYIKLIENKQIKLNSVDYEFMEKNKEVFKNNHRYEEYLDFKKNQVKKTDTYPIVPSNNKLQKAEERPTIYQSELRNDSPLKYIDLSRMSPSYKANTKTLTISLFFMNKESDELVRWENEDVIVNCNIFENRGNFMNQKKGALIGSKHNKVLNRSLQSIYITLTNTKYKNGIAECKSNIGGRVFINRETFSIYGNTHIDSLRKNTSSIEIVEEP